MTQAGTGEIRLRPLLVVLAAMILAGCQTTAAENPFAVPPAAAAAPEPEPVEEPMTREKASSECWMRLEKTRPGGSVDTRLVIVEKCIAEKLKAAEQAQIVPKPRPDPKPTQ